MLSTHFSVEEFGDVPEDCLPTLEFFCQNILEPIRAHIDRPMEIMSGYRSSEANMAIHGAPNSEHIYTPDHCAADFTFQSGPGGQLLSKRTVFDWIRLNKTIPFHQVILEFGNGDSIIHISFNKTTLYARAALEGRTYNAAPYIKFETIPYELPDETESV